MPGYLDMTLARETRASRWHAFAFFLLTSLIVLSYSNSFQASWHLDDYHNIVQNPRLKIDDLNLDSIRNSFYASQDKGLYLGQSLYRPVACLTFGLNWFAGGDRVWGYHLVNVAIHIAAAYFLYLTIGLLLSTGQGRLENDVDRHFVALLGAVLWAVNPIQTQAVSYIVQRMASLSAMFYVAAVYAYLRMRTARTQGGQLLSACSCASCFLLALGSKENAALLPASLVLIEFIFFQDLGNPKIRKMFWGGAALSLVAVVGLGLWAWHFGALKEYLSYSQRPFSLSERLLTQPRVLVLYLSQIIYPAPTRLSIEHDVAVSTSWVDPWTTLPSILVVVALIGLGFLRVHRQPLLSFAILFYFLNHLIESTIIPLELVFEHRNYLPSFFLFAPLALALRRGLNCYQSRRSSMRYILTAGLSLWIIGLGSATYIRNMAWADEQTLWEDAMQKAPQSARPVHNLAWGHFERIGRSDIALELYRRAFDLRSPSRTQKAMTLNNMAGIYYSWGNYSKAIDLWERAAALAPEVELLEFRLALSLAKHGNLQSASERMDTILAKRPHMADYNYLKGSILLKQGRLESSLAFYRKAFRSSPHNPKAARQLGIVLAHMNHPDRAEMFFARALAGKPDDPKSLVWVALINAGRDKVELGKYTERIVSLVTFDQLVMQLEDVPLSFLPQKQTLIGFLEGKIASAPFSASGTKNTHLILAD
jgi:tetratricopeptide (TPR) repeat protein